MNERYTIVNDSNGHRWICPESKVDAVEASIAAVEEYWEMGDYDKEEPEDLTETLELPKWEGQQLTFEKPELK